MSIFDNLETQYHEIDNLYSTLEFEARGKNQRKKEAKYSKKRKLNDQAYFLFMFTRLEEIIETKSSALIARKKQSRLSWKQKSVWDILPDSPHFLNRLALLSEKGREDYNLVKEYYRQRNEIAHGGNFTRPMSMPTVISEFKRLYNKIKSFK